jgi:6-phosphogluconolactonase/glucosamine-6-phosphate isomerase/deaminase
MGATPTIHVLPDIPAAQRAAAEEFMERTEAAVQAHGVAFVALSGGSTPRGRHTLLADPAEPFRTRVSWTREKPSRPDAYPSQAIRPETGALLWLIDRAAAARLGAPTGR